MGYEKSSKQIAKSEERRAKNKKQKNLSYSFNKKNIFC